MTLHKEACVVGKTFAQHIKNDMCPIATFRFQLPDEQNDYDAARLGRQMASVLWEIDQACRAVVKYEQEPSPDRVQLAEQIRQLIRDGCPDAMEL